jgi:glycosyltransferase involved in cell wall biosynthesis
MEVLENGGDNGVDSEGRFNPDLIEQQQVARIKDQLGIPEHAPIVGFVGRIVRSKGIGELQQAWEIVLEKQPDAHLVIIGPREDADEVPGEILEALEDDSTVHIVGEIRNEELPYYYAMMTVVVLPSYREGFPTVPLEAAAMGRPAVVTNVTGCIDAVIGELTGTIVPLGDIAAPAEAIVRYITDSTLRDRHGKAAQERVRRDFRPENMWHALFNEYTRMLADKGINRDGLSAPKGGLSKSGISEKMVT